MIYTYLRHLLCSQSGLSNFGRLHFLYFGISNSSPAVPEFATSQLPNTQLLDGWNSRHLPIGQEKVVTESLRRGNRRPYRSSSRFLIGHVLGFYVIRIYPSMIPFYLLLRLRSGCLNSRSDRARNAQYLSQINENHCSRMKIRLR